MSRCKWDKTIYNDRGNPISCKLKTKAFDLGSPIYYKFFEDDVESYLKAYFGIDYKVFQQAKAEKEKLLAYSGYAS